MEDPWCPPICGCGALLAKPEDWCLEPLTDDPKHRVYEELEVNQPLLGESCQENKKLSLLYSRND